MRAVLKGRLRYVFLAAVLVGIYFAFNYQEIVHRAAILRALDPAFPARAYERDILAVDWGGTHALVRVAPTSGCDRSFDVELSWHDGWWWMEKLTEINDPGCFS